MKRTKSAIGSLALTALLLILLGTFLPGKSQGGKSGLKLGDFDSPPATSTPSIPPRVRASNLILIEFFAGY